MPLLIQGAAEHDVIFVAGEEETFGEYLLFRSAEPRPVVGTHGLVATAWHRSFEEYAATQMQNRFERKAGRAMGERDYAGWLAVRIFGEAITRTATASPAVLLDLGLSHAVEQLVGSHRRRHPETEFALDLPESGWGSQIDGALYYVIRESIGNGLRHGKPSRIEVAAGQRADGSCSPYRTMAAASLRGEGRPVSASWACARAAVPTWTSATSCRRSISRTPITR